MNNCVICQKTLGFKTQRLHGMKCQTHKTQQTLKMLLHPCDFKALYSDDTFSDPRICNICFVTIEKIPQGLHKIQELFGEPINTRLDQPDREQWDMLLEDIPTTTTTEIPALSNTDSTHSGSSKILHAGDKKLSRRPSELKRKRFGFYSQTYSRCKRNASKRRACEPSETQKETDSTEDNFACQNNEVALKYTNAEERTTLSKVSNGATVSLAVPADGLETDTFLTPPPRSIALQKKSTNTDTVSVCSNPVVLDKNSASKIVESTSNSNFKRGTNSLDVAENTLIDNAQRKKNQRCMTSRNVKRCRSVNSVSDKLLLCAGGKVERGQVSTRRIGKTADYAQGSPEIKTKQHRKDDLNYEERGTFTCEEEDCADMFTTQKAFFDHFLEHYTTAVCKCDVPGCGLTFPSLLSKSRHTRLHFDGSYVCPWPECDKRLASSFFSMKTHVYKHIISDLPHVAEHRPHRCPQCPMVFKRQKNLESHLAQHREQPASVCPTCGKKFRRTHLQRHLLTHRQQKPHSCQHCDKRYATVNGLKFHVLQEHAVGKWPYQCSHCQKGFVTSNDLMRHMTSHTRERPFSCHVCHTTFSTQTGLRGHMRKHSGQKFTCDASGCGKTYSSPQALRDHRATHQGFSRTCPHCGRTYHTPHGHRCKAGREARRKKKQEGTPTSELNSQPEAISSSLSQSEVDPGPNQMSAVLPRSNIPVADTLPHPSILSPEGSSPYLNPPIPES